MAVPNVRNWEAQVLRGIGAPITAKTVKALRAWNQAEGGSASNNPFNTTQGAQGASDYNSVHVRNYPDWNTGLRATIETLTNGHYGNIIKALRYNADPAVVADTIGASPWGTSGALIRKVLGAGPAMDRRVRQLSSAAPAFAVSSKGQYQGFQPRIDLVSYVLANNQRLMSGQTPYSPLQFVNDVQQPETTAPAASAPTVTAVNPRALQSAKVTGLNTDFASRVNALEKVTGVKISSGYRSVQEQTQLWNAALKKYGSAQAARNWVAPPGHSNHNKGLAADLSGTPEQLAAAHRLADKFGLTFPMSNEPWHIEPIGIR